MSDKLRIAREQIDGLMEQFVGDREPSLQLAYDVQLIRILMILSELCNAVEGLEKTEHWHYANQEQG